MSGARWVPNRGCSPRYAARPCLPTPGLRLATPRVGARNGNADVKVSDHTMTILTGLVLTVTIGMLAQNSESIMAGLTGRNVLQPEDDAFTVRAGKPQMLNLLLNDQAPEASTETAILIMQQPNCGELAQSNGQIEYTNSQTCQGPVTFTYCLSADIKCAEAKVALQVLPHQNQGLVVASAELAEQPSSPTVLPSDEPVEVAQSPSPSDPAIVPEDEASVVTASIRDFDPAVLPENAPISVPAELSPIAELPVEPDLALPDRLASVDFSPAASELTIVETAELLPMDLPESRLQDDLPMDLPIATPVVLANVAITAENLTAVSLGTGLDSAANESAAAPAIESTTAAATCTAQAVALPAAGGEISLSLSAPCNPNSPVVIRQGDFEFAAKTDSSGALTTTFPAFAARATVELLLPDGVTKSLQVDVPGADRFTRVAVLWSGAVDLELRAGEYGAGLGQSGYIWSGAPRSYRQSRKFGGGYLQSFGIGNSFAEIYTLPNSKRQTNGVIDLSLHVADSGAACEKAVDLRILRFTGGKSSASNVRFTLGACNANKADYEVINALSDLRVASR